MKSLLIVASWILIFSTGTYTQDAYYFSSCYMNGDLITVGRAKVFSNVYKAELNTNKKQLKDQYWEYLNKEKPSASLKDYFKHDVENWGEAAVRNIYVFGPYSYLKAQQMLRKEMKSSRSRDWLVLKINGFGYFPNKYKVK